MKVCCNSHSYERMLSAGELTQLEWVDLCANELNLDGVEFALAHFPRLDADYVAQLKKLCVDRCLTVAGVNHDVALTSIGIHHQVDALGSALDVALLLGAPLVRFGLRSSPSPPAEQWRELVFGLKEACVKAKQLNVTLALEPRDGTPVASPTDAKRISKECDSAWLRLATNTRALASAQRDQWVEPLATSVIVVAPVASLDTFGADESIDYIGALSFLWQHHYRGFLTLEYGGEEAERPAVARAVAWLRGMVAKDTLKAAVTS
jgi:sugar phosphate isomerase/epimerase